MTPEFIETLSKKSAYKYYNTSHYDDLVSEGILAAYEELDKNPQAPEQRVYQVINWAQWKFLNGDCLPGHMQENLVRMVKWMGSENLETNYTDESFEWAKVILSQSQAQSGYHDTDHTSNQEEELSKEDLLGKIWEAAQECLTYEEYSLFSARFESGFTQDDLSKTFEADQSVISRKLSAVCDKVRKKVLNKKWEL